MKIPQRESNGPPESQNHDDSLGALGASDVARYLRLLARSLQEEKTGNPALSGELRHLSEMLRAHGSRPIAELAITDKGAGFPFVWEPRAPFENALNGKPPRENRRDQNGSARVPALSPRMAKSTLPDDLKTLSREEVERILKDDALTKQQIAELGYTRFGISKPSLMRLRKDLAIGSILTALRNERTMHVIYEQAGKAGRMRSA